MQESFQGLFPGPGVTEGNIVDWATRYAPLVRFDRSEVHFPSDPEEFRKAARFRESLYLKKDRGWNKDRDEWVQSKDETDPYFAVDWDVIREESLDRLPGPWTLQPWMSRNVRPFDGRSIHARPGRTTPTGLFLQRDERLPKNTSGPPPVGTEVSAPVFLDAEYNPSADSYRVLYWFFYELNEWWGIHAHQGDWEHLSFIVSSKALEKKKPPSHVYFAQHNTGNVLRFTSLEQFEKGHRIVFVDKNGHPTRPSVSNPGEYTYEWRTWKSDMRLIVKAPWRDFPGAWGAVGSSAGFTGPLGPLYKRQKDLVRITRRQGKLYVRAFEK